MDDFYLFSAQIAFLLICLQMPAVAILLSRLLKGATRKPPIQPQTASLDLFGSVSVIVPTLNEAARISPLLAGLGQQSYEIREIIVVDSNSQDGTPELVQKIQTRDPRFRVITDDPLPKDWVGRPWALNYGFKSMSTASTWFLGMDADTQPQPGLVAGLVKAAQAGDFDLVSLSPQFILKYPGECWLQPALLMTLLYRFDSAGVNAIASERVMANGQCFLCKRSVLASVNGYSSAKGSFCDDVTLARNIAAAGFKVGFLDGAKVFKVRMYDGAKETWQEWGRSLDLKDAATFAQTWGDIWFLTATQGLPLLILLGLVFLGFLPGFPSTYLPINILIGLNGFLLLIRFGMQLAIAPSYDLNQAKFGWLFWLSPLADPLAVIRIILSALRTPKSWRGRSYSRE